MDGEASTEETSTAAGPRRSTFPDICLTAEDIVVPTALLEVTFGCF